MAEQANPRILIVNDDGIDAPGIRLLEEVARGFSDDVWVVAPDEERSGAGHSMSLATPTRVKKRGERHFAVKGTPTDCAMLGICDLLEGRKPDVLLSGVNRGPNLAEDLTYSGTAGAAMEGALLGVPSIAFSQICTYSPQIPWETSRIYARIVLEKLLALKPEPGVFHNVNFPDCEPDQVKGIRVTRLGLRPPGNFHPVRRVDERNTPYYWIKTAFQKGGDAPDNDLGAALDHMVSITPVQLDMTADRLLPELKALFASS